MPKKTALQRQYRLATISEAAAVFDMSPGAMRTLRTAVEKGRIGCIRLAGGRRRLVDLQEVERALERFPAQGDGRPLRLDGAKNRKE